MKRKATLLAMRQTVSEEGACTFWNTPDTVQQPQHCYHRQCCYNWHSFMFSQCDKQWTCTRQFWLLKIVPLHVFLKSQGVLLQHVGQTSTASQSLVKSIYCAQYMCHRGVWLNRKYWCFFFFFNKNKKKWHCRYWK